MGYPMKEVHDFWSGGTTYREMTPEEYERKLDWFRTYLRKHEYAEGLSRREVEYLNYLQTWFSGARCDGLPSFYERYMLHTLPMSFTVYFCF